jgi:hypothetical protein
MSIELLINFEIFISTNGNFLLSFTIFFDLEEIIFENLNNSKNNIVSVKLAKVLGYLFVSKKGFKVA